MNKGKLVCISCSQPPTWGKWEARYATYSPELGQLYELEPSEDENTPRINYCDNRDCPRYAG